ncbi:MAG: efflux RND transporter periplasmic adaptor subunit [Proteobacteria bacterium]|nr:efflux RND transporter periplasmic adaptor subunit [Pseudomonadota bacterium]
MKKYPFLSLLFLFLPLVFSCENNTIPPGFSMDTTQNDILVQHTTGVESRQITQIYEAVGTIRPLTETIIESQVSSQVLKINVVPGARVEAGQVLVLLDTRQLNTRLEQAKQGLAYANNTLSQAQKAIDEAKAGQDQTSFAYQRTKTLFEKEVVTSQQMEIDRAAFLQAKARYEKSREGDQAARSNIRQATEVVKEAMIGLGYASIKAPASGVVVERLIDPGDQAVPGKPLLIVQTSGSLRLEARVREGLIGKIIHGNPYEVGIETLETNVTATIEEIAPYADPSTRTFLVKAALPDTPGLYPGMFGRLLIPVKTQATLLIPKEAVIQVGHLEMVNVHTPDDNNKKRYRSVYIKTGKTIGQKIEVLSGLTGTETLGY